MEIGNGRHLTYCTNIHAGETWNDIFPQLKKFLPEIKRQLSPNSPFGIGLRLSNRMSEDLLDRVTFDEFTSWLSEQDLYVFTMNGFPYGGFHRQVVKDSVHHPDWTTIHRLQYTKRLFNLLANLLPDGIDGGISTSPLSYKPWYDGDKKKYEAALDSSTRNILRIVQHLAGIHRTTGKLLHLDLEPEPDGLLECTGDVIDYFENRLLPTAAKFLPAALGVTPKESNRLIKEYIRVCYDICHLSVAYEKPKEAIARLKKYGIKIGKIQITAALQATLPKSPLKRKPILAELERFAEPVYLHQAVTCDQKNKLTRYSDLDYALKDISSSNAQELRTHFHVPIYKENFGKLESTQAELIETLSVLNRNPFSNHLEVETYTWELLPESERTDLIGSITRELEWVIKQMKDTKRRHA
ncbi:MAG: metabolite traffic protein EboE [Bacteroidota bacterium]